jgi:hypothetical protein
MSNQLQVSPLVQQLLGLPHRLKMVAMAVKVATLANSASAHRPLRAPHPQRVAEQEVTGTATGAGTAGSRHLSHNSDWSTSEEDVPMQHLFLFDMKIGR